MPVDKPTQKQYEDRINKLRRQLDAEIKEKQDLKLQLSHSKASKAAQEGARKARKPVEGTGDDLTSKSFNAVMDGVLGMESTNFAVVGFLDPDFLQERRDNLAKAIALQVAKEGESKVEAAIAAQTLVDVKNEAKSKACGQRGTSSVKQLLVCNVTDEEGNNVLEDWKTSLGDTRLPQNEKLKQSWVYLRKDDGLFKTSDVMCNSDFVSDPLDMYLITITVQKKWRRDWLRHVIKYDPDMQDVLPDVLPDVQSIEDKHVDKYIEQFKDEDTRDLIVPSICACCLMAPTKPCTHLCGLRKLFKMIALTHLSKESLPEGAQIFMSDSAGRVIKCKDATDKKGNKINAATKLTLSLEKENADCLPAIFPKYLPLMAPAVAKGVEPEPPLVKYDAVSKIAHNLFLGLVRNVLDDVKEDLKWDFDASFDTIVSTAHVIVMTDYAAELLNAINRSSAGLWRFFNQGNNSADAFVDKAAKADADKAAKADAEAEAEDEANDEMTGANVLAHMLFICFVDWLKNVWGTLSQIRFHLQGKADDAWWNEIAPTTNTLKRLTRQLSQAGEDAFRKARFDPLLFCAAQNQKALNASKCFALYLPQKVQKALLIVLLYGGGACDRYEKTPVKRILEGSAFIRASNDPSVAEFTGNRLAIIEELRAQRKRLLPKATVERDEAGKRKLKQAQDKAAITKQESKARAAEELKSSFQSLFISDVLLQNSIAKSLVRTKLNFERLMREHGLSASALLQSPDAAEDMAELKKGIPICLVYVHFRSSDSDIPTMWRSAEHTVQVNGFEQLTGSKVYEEVSKMPPFKPFDHVDLDAESTTTVTPEVPSLYVYMAYKHIAVLMNKQDDLYKERGETHKEFKKVSELTNIQKNDMPLLTVEIKDVKQFDSLDVLATAASQQASSSSEAAGGGHGNQAAKKKRLDDGFHVYVPVKLAQDEPFNVPYNFQGFGPMIVVTNLAPCDKDDTHFLGNPEAPFSVKEDDSWSTFWRNTAQVLPVCVHACCLCRKPLTQQCASRIGPRRKPGRAASEGQA